MRITITTRTQGSRRVADPDPLIAAVPALLGFVPERSIVLMCFDHRSQITATMRHDLHWTRGGRASVEMKRLLGRLGELSESYGACGVVAVLVDDRVDPADERYDLLAREVHRAFRAIGGLTAGFAARDLVLGQRWRTVWQPDRSSGGMFPGDVAECGELTDPQASPAALHRSVYSGRGILGRRSELEEMLAFREHCDDAICRSVSPIPPSGPADEVDRARLALLYATVVEWSCDGGTRALSCDRVNALADALLSIQVRDAVLGFGLTVHHEAAENLWRDLARRLSGTPRAAAATLLGYLHYMEGSGAFASTAFDAAHAADPEYSLANLLDTALVNGLPPRELRGLAELSFDLAHDLGVELPPAADRAAG
ncbi:DUF4192 domain-containing protein [Gordonia zhaorongruii]|uniref:DUF4192 domain-containing protein n=1 Tax=Gordonia zhaorongruii TaxID=2597659 RepID=UPI001180DF3F|nr:DUF4192 domain-containing protein [Gordonia zhaorongruii]